jgi:GT2 family glycosyltransferase
MSLSICASIVIYQSDALLLQRALEALDAALARATSAGLAEQSRVTLIDNDAPVGPIVDEAFAPPFAPLSPAAWRRISGHGNVGYGRGHNLVLRELESDHYLVLNPDALLDPDALVCGLRHLRSNTDCGLVAPFAEGPDGAPQFLCKRYPDLLTLLLRAAAPAAIRRLFAQRLGHYELRDVIGEDAGTPAPGVPLASGSCMLLRADVVHTTNGFDPAFFVYFEDYDLSLRITERSPWRIDYAPSMRIVHHGGNAARKNLAHVRMFAAGAFRFFHRHGWKLA